MNEEFRSENGDYGRKSSKLPVVLLTIIVLVLLGVVAFLLNDKYEWIKLGEKSTDNKTEEKDTKKEQTNKDAYLKIDNTKGLYYTEEGKSYKVYSPVPDIYDGNEKSAISFSYPVINSKTESVTKVNAEVKKLYDDLKKAPAANSEKKRSDNCICVKIDDKEYCGSHIREYRYKTLESDSVLNVIIYERTYTNCAGGGERLIKSYFVSKKTGKVLTNDEVLKIFGYKSSEFISAYNKYVKEFTKKHNDERKTVKSADELMLVLTKESDSLFANDTVSVYGPVYTNAPGDVLDFDGTEFSDPYEKLNEDEDLEEE